MHVSMRVCVCVCVCIAERTKSHGACLWFMSRTYTHAFMQPRRMHKYTVTHTACMTICAVSHATTLQSSISW